MSFAAFVLFASATGLVLHFVLAVPFFTAMLAGGLLAAVEAFIPLRR